MYGSQIQSEFTYFTFFLLIQFYKKIVLLSKLYTQLRDHAKGPIQQLKIGRQIPNFQSKDTKRLKNYDNLHYCTTRTSNYSLD
ncbi:hypothetical protein pb186bvf_020181 [Paramecium bursaria]